MFAEEQILEEEDSRTDMQSMELTIKRFMVGNQIFTIIN